MPGRDNAGAGFGYDAFKFRVGAECGRNQDQWPGRSEEIVAAVRKTLGDEVDLLVDGNSLAGEINPAGQ